MNLFDYEIERNKNKIMPLAARMRPKTLEDFVGQEHIVAKGTLLYRAIMTDKLSSVIFYGPAGTGKTTLARIIANTTRGEFVQLNATNAGIKDIKAVVEEARAALGRAGRKTILFVDEIHRFNKAQQDALLPHIEDGTVVLIGSTTENPYFEVNRAVLSRSIIFQLKHLTQKDIRKLLDRVLIDRENGYGNLNVVASNEALDFLADAANGDARNAINALELAVLTTDETDGQIVIDLDTASQCIQKRPLNYDKDGDNHYDTISAFIKSMRGSDPDAAVYYLARMLYAGEDPKFIARRIVICASEDVGNADPHALMVAVAAAQAVDFVGLPEGRIILAQAAAYIACAPKSNSSIKAIDKASKAVADVQISGVPLHLRDACYKGAEQFGNGIGYKYAHDFPGHYVKQQYLPDELAGERFYFPSDNGVEKKIKETLERLKEME